MSYTFVNQSASTGTGTVTTTGTAVVGSGSAFNTQLAVGEVIIIGSQKRHITVITDSTHLTLDSALSANLSNQAFSFFPAYSYQAKH